MPHSALIKLHRDGRNHYGCILGCTIVPRTALCIVFGCICTKHIMNYCYKLHHTATTIVSQRTGFSRSRLLSLFHLTQKKTYLAYLSPAGKGAQKEIRERRNERVGGGKE